MWPDWLKVIQLKPRFLLGLWLIGTLILFLPSSVANSLGIVLLREHYRGWIGLATLSAFSFWVIQLWPLLRRWQQNRRRKAEILEAINSLSVYENFLLAYCLDRNQRTICLKITDVAAGSLCQKGLLIRADNGHFMAFPHTIPLFVWRHLQELKPQILPQEALDNPNYRKLFDEFERNLISLRI